MNLISMPYLNLRQVGDANSQISVSTFHSKGILTLIVVVFMVIGFFVS